MICYMNILNLLVGIFVILGVLFIISGHKENFDIMNIETSLSTRDVSNSNFMLEKICVNKEDCRPGFDCRRVGFYCSKIG